MWLSVTFALATASELGGASAMRSAPRMSAPRPASVATAAEEDGEPERRTEMEEEDEPFVEPICREDPSRFVLLPIHQPELWRMYKQHVASFWTAEEIDLGPDKVDWARLTPDERHFVCSVLAFFAASDGIVVENLAERFCRDVTLPEARCFYG